MLSSESEMNEGAGPADIYALDVGCSCAENVGYAAVQYRYGSGLITGPSVHYNGKHTDSGVEISTLDG